MKTKILKILLVFMLLVASLCLVSQTFNPPYISKLNWIKIDDYRSYTVFNGITFYRTEWMYGYQYTYKAISKDGLIEFTFRGGFSDPKCRMILRFIVDKNSPSYDKFGKTDYFRDGKKTALMFMIEYDMTKLTSVTVKYKCAYLDFNMLLLSSIDTTGKKDTHDYETGGEYIYDKGEYYKPLDYLLYHSGCQFWAPRASKNNAWIVYFNEFYHWYCSEEKVNTKRKFIPCTYKGITAYVNFDCYKPYPSIYHDGESLIYGYAFSPFVLAAFWSVLKNNYIDMKYYAPANSDIGQVLSKVSKNNVTKIGKVDYPYAESFIFTVLSFIIRIEDESESYTVFTPIVMYTLCMIEMGYNNASSIWKSYED